MYTYTCKLVKVIDGDTVILDVDLGFHVTVRETFRLEGINAPEMDTDAGKDARNFLLGVLGGYGLIIDSTKAIRREKYGRWLATIRLNGSPAYMNGTNVNDLMVTAGHAVPYNP